jgi:CheY-like chemotaxis protein
MWGPTPSEDPLGEMSILVADDHPINRELIRRMLVGLGQTAFLVEDGAAAFAAVRERRFDLVLMDVQMPVLSGPDATRLIRQWKPRVDGRGPASWPLRPARCRATGRLFWRQEWTPTWPNRFGVRSSKRSCVWATDRKHRSICTECPKLTNFTNLANLTNRFSRRVQRGPKCHDASPAGSFAL